MIISQKSIAYPFQTVAIGGTFDRLHNGHERFISQAFKMGRKVIIGLTSDEYVEKKLKVKSEKSKVIPAVIVKDAKPPRGYSQGLTRGEEIGIKSHGDRKKELINFLRKKNLLSRAQIVKIDDIYGPAAESQVIEALVVTSETYQGARKINRKRKEKGLSPLKIMKIPLVLAGDRRRISSSRIRLGEIDRWGRVYSAKFKVQSARQKRGSPKAAKCKISQSLRQELKKPQGKLIKGNPKDHKKVLKILKKTIVGLNPVMIITVGDEVTRLCKNHLSTPNISIIDFKVARKKKYSSLAELGFSTSGSKSLKDTSGIAPLSGDSPEVERSRKPIFTILTCKNPPGHITKTLVLAISKAIKQYIRTGGKQIIKVVGEEDLAALPAILLAPLGSVVFYGQPGEGVVVVEVTEEEKGRLVDLIIKSVKR